MNAGVNFLAAPRGSSWMLAVLPLMLVVEGLALTLRFDSASIEEIDATWAVLLGQTWLLGRFAIAAATAMIVFAGPDVARIRSLRGLRQRLDGRAVIALGIHFLAFAWLYCLTALLLESSHHTVSSAATAWVIAWVLSGFLTVAAWAAALAPMPFWYSAIQAASGYLAAAALLAIAAISASQAVGYSWTLLSGPTFKGVVTILELFYSDVSAQPDILTIRVDGYEVIIDPECSGFEGIGLILVFLGGFLWSFRKRLLFPQAWALLPIGMAAIWVSNILRLVLLIAIGASFSESVANGGFHSQAGWIAFNVVSLVLVYVAWKHPLFHQATEGSGDAQRYEYVAGPYLLPLLALLASMMVTAAFSGSGFDWLYPLRVAAALCVLAYYWPTYRSRGYVQASIDPTSVLIGVAVFAIWRALEPASSAAVSYNLEFSQALQGVSPVAAACWLGFRALGSIISVPLAEELAFRGYLTRRLIDEEFERVPSGAFSWFSFLVSSAVFGALHGRWLAGIVAGALFATALYRRRQLMDAIVAHVVANALITSYVLWSEDWFAWS